MTGYEEEPQSTTVTFIFKVQFLKKKYEFHEFRTKGPLKQYKK